MSTHNIQFHNEIFVLICWINFVGTLKRVRISHGERAIGVRAIEIRLYVRFYSKSGSDRMYSYYIMCLIMPCAAVRKHNSETVIAFVYIPPRI